MEPLIPPPENKKTTTWPIIINLILLVMVVVFSGGSLDVLPWAILALTFINGVAAGIIAISGGRIHYVLALVLSCLIILLVGFGTCALILSNWHGGGH